MNRRWTFVLAALVVLVLLTGLVPAAASAAPPADSYIIHVVRPGETLSSIARYYGVNMWAIARANNILNPNRIYVGQRLVIPTGGSGGFYHVVQPGETLTRIAARYGVTTWAIAQANGLYNINYIWVGQRLWIPGGYAPTPPPPPPSPPPSPPPPPVGGAWYGQYYSNLTLTEPPSATRYDAAISFNWGWGAPVAGVAADYFSARWTGTVYFDGGTYRFYARVDDGVRVWVDGVLIIDQWRDGALRTFSADRALTAGNHDLRVEYYDRIQVARIYFWWEKLSGPTPEPTTPAPTGAWRGVYYNNAYLMEPAAATVDVPEINFNWGEGSPLPGISPENFSIRWSRTVYFDAGTYVFCMTIDDGGRIWVDGSLVVDEWHLTPVGTFCREKSLSAGNHLVVVEYFEWTYSALVHVWWERR